MPNYKLFRTGGSLIAALVLLALTVLQLTTAAAFAPVTSTEHGRVTFDGVSSGSDLQGAGHLRFGRLVWLALDADTQARVTKNTWHEATQTPQDLELQISSGRVFLADNLWGARVTLSDERASAMSQGGTAIFESLPAQTRITALDGSLLVHFTDPTAATGSSSSVLLPGQSIDLNSANLSRLQAVEGFARVETWQELVSTDTGNRYFAETNLAANQKLLTGLAKGFAASHAVTRSKWWSDLRAELTILPTARARLAQAAAADIVSTLLADPATLEPDGTGLTAELAAELPLTRLIAPNTLSPLTRQSLADSAEIEPKLARLAEVELLPPELALARSWQLSQSLASPAAAAKWQQIFLATAQSLDPATPISDELALVAYERWLYSVAATATAEQIQTFGRIAAVAPDREVALHRQLLLAKQLFLAGNQSGALAALTSFSELLASSTTAVPYTALDRLATRAQAIKHRLEYLAANPAVDFTEAEYAQWAATQPTVDGKIARPSSAFEKFMSNFRNQAEQQLAAGLASLNPELMATPVAVEPEPQITAEAPTPVAPTPEPVAVADPATPADPTDPAAAPEVADTASAAQLRSSLLGAPLPGLPVPGTPIPRPRR